jgi:uncharacterized phage infection (PIP) family protein YhgE
MRTPRRIAWLVAPMVVLSLSMTACGGGGGDSADACSAAKDFTDSVTALKAVDPVTDGTDALKTAAQNVADAAGALETAAKDQFGSQASAVKAAYQQLADGLADAVDPASAAQAMTSGVANIKDQQAALEEEIANACPSS